MSIVEVRLWGTRIGALRWDPAINIGSFEFAPDFLRSGIEVAPLMMPLGPGVWSFPALAPQTFKGLPGLVADSLPDKFGTALIDAWLARQGRSSASFSPAERLCYVGTRGMGALEFEPAVDRDEPSESPLDIAGLVELAQAALRDKDSLAVSPEALPTQRDLTEIIRVGTSAGGARAKAVIAWNETTNEIRSGQLDQPSEFEHWLLKFDGVDGNRDRELADPLGFGRVEHAYGEMARACGIDMPRTRLLEEGGRAHFMTQRFDRVGGDKLHMQTLTAIAHFDFNLAGAYGYEQAFQVMRRLRLGHGAMVEQFRRAIFNVVARNQDDHTKNISFLMNRRGEWSLAPAYDVTYAYNPAGEWTSAHQMTISGKRDGFERADLLELAVAADLRHREANHIIDEVIDVVGEWPSFAERSGVSVSMTSAIYETLRLSSLGAP